MHKASLSLVPVVRAVVTGVIATGVFATMLAIDSAANGGHPPTPAFAIWAASASVALIVWIAMLLAGIRRIAVLDALWRPTRLWILGALILVLILGAAATVFLRLLEGVAGRAGPDPGARTIVQILTPVGWAATAPWLLLLWVTGQRVRALGTTIVGKPAPAVRYAVTEMDAIWQVIERSSLALGLILSTLVVDTALMRNVWIADGVSAEEFSPWMVIGYGVFFVVMSSSS